MKPQKDAGEGMVDCDFHEIKNCVSTVSHKNRRDIDRNLVVLSIKIFNCLALSR